MPSFASGARGSSVTLLANVFIVAFAVDGTLSLLDELLQWAAGIPLLSRPRGVVASIVLLACVPYYVLVGLTPRLPKRLFLPLIFFLLWCALGALPLSSALEYAPIQMIVLSLLQVALAVLALLQIHRATSGASWLFTHAALAGPTFRARSTLLFLTANVFVVLPALALYGVLGVSAAISEATAGFVEFDRVGASLAERRYVRGDREIRLIGMMHIGESDSYRELFESFPSESTVVLTEGVSDEDERLDFLLSYEKLAVNLGLGMQPPVEEILEEAPAGETEVAAHPEVKNADLDARAFSPETVAFLRAASVLWESENLLAGAREFLELMEATESDRMLESVNRDLILMRNEHLLAEIADSLEHYRRVVVPWGALHMPEVERKILAEGFTPSGSFSRRLLRYSTVLAALSRLPSASDSPTAP